MFPTRLVLAAALSLAVCLPLTAEQRAPQAASLLEILPPHDARQAQREFELGQKAEQVRDWRAAFRHYGLAVSLWPQEREYVAGRERARLQLMQQHVDRADRAALARQFERARSELLAALGLDPYYSVARERLEQLPPPPQTATQDYDLDRIGLKPQPGVRSFNVRGDTIRAYEEVAGQFGVTASFDPDLPVRQIRFRVENVDFETAMRLLGRQTGTFWRAVDERAFFVAADTPQKRTEYGPTVERALYLPNLITPDRTTETLRIVSEIGGLTRSQINTASRTVVLRGAPYAVALAEALLRDLEQASGEVMLEIEILEVDRRASRRLGISPPTSTQVITLSPSDIREAQESLEGFLRVILRLFGTPANLTGLTPEQILLLIGAGQVGQAALIPPLVAFGGGNTVFFATLPGAAAEFSETLSVVRQGRRMLLRAEDGQPASFFLGERFPISFSRLTPSFFDPLLTPALREGQFQAPFPAFQFEELGLKVRATPRLHPNNEVTLQLEFEIRSRSGEELNGIPVLSNRTIEQTVRLREDETSVIAGILQQEERRGIQGWPGLSAVPVAGHLAGTRDRQDREAELLIFITPRRIRLAPRTDFSLYAGREPGGTGPTRTALPRPPTPQP